MRHLIAQPFVILSSAMTLACVIAGPAAAQQAPTNGAGLRYLSWPGKPAVAASSPARRPTTVALAGGGATRDPALPPLARLDAPAPAAPAATAPNPVASPHRGLTPATAWSAPTAAAPNTGLPRAYPSPTPQVQPRPVQAETEATPIASTPEPSPAPPAPTPVLTPTSTQAPAPASVQASQAAAPAAAEPVPAMVDPMAPRRDAAIFRLQRPQGVEPAPPAAAAPNQIAALQPQTQAQGVRYYSVHRQAGRQPDAIPAPQQTYLDALPVEMSQTPSSTDLAQPDAPPALVRDASGKVRPMPQTEPDALP